MYRQLQVSPDLMPACFWLLAVCTAVWAQQSTYPATGSSAWGLSTLQAFQHSGRNITISFGGANADGYSEDLSQACSSSSALAAQYQAVIDAYGPVRIDMDIEGGLQDDTTALVSRNEWMTTRFSWRPWRMDGSMVVTLPLSYKGLVGC